MPYFIVLTSLSKMVVRFSCERHSPVAFHGQNTEVLQKAVTVWTSRAGERASGRDPALRPLTVLVFSRQVLRRAVPWR